MILPSFNIIHFLVAIFIIGPFILKLPAVKGAIGECIVHLFGKLLLDKKTYHLIRDVTFPTEDGTTQIDHIIVSKYGIFVVETKNYAGWIFGDEFSPQWTQTIYKKKSRFQNPLRQNFKHVKTLCSILNLEEEKIFSVIVFVGGSEFKTPMPENVTKGIGYIGFIKSKQYEVFTDTEAVDIIAKIENFRLERGFSTNHQHRANLKNRFQGSQEVSIRESTPIRNSRLGKFDVWKVFAISCAVIGIVFFSLQVIKSINKSIDSHPNISKSQISKSTGDSPRSTELRKPQYKGENKEKSSSFSDIDIQRAKERTLAERAPSPIGVNEDLYEIELLSGKKIYAKNARVEDGKVIFLADIGQEVGINMNDVQAVRQLSRR